MRTTLSLQPELFEGTEKQARTLVRELLASRLHPVFIVKEAVIPEVEASGTALKSGSFQVGQLPALGISLQAVMEEIEDSLHNAGLSLHFRIGRASDDVFDLWGTVIAGAFEAAGFSTFRSSELNRCELITVCKIASAPSVRSYTPGPASPNDCLTASEIWHGSIAGNSILTRNSGPMPRDLRSELNLAPAAPRHASRTA